MFSDGVYDVLLWVTLSSLFLAGTFSGIASFVSYNEQKTKRIESLEEKVAQLEQLFSEQIKPKGTGR